MKSFDYILIEDNPDDIELILDALGELERKFSHLVLRDGEEANAFIDKMISNGTARPKVIILDLKLPKLSGFELLTKLKNSERTKAIPVVALTSSKAIADIYKSYELGVNAYVIKPIDYDDFVKVVSRMGSFWLLHNDCP